jgi:hypothetical protein
MGTFVNASELVTGVAIWAYAVVPFFGCASVGGKNQQEA